MSRPFDASSRLRFAPSPTGTLHVGGARTALFNYLLARRHGGKFILRIEDTDRERSTQESVEVILNGLKWLGLEWDEGPFYQSKRGEHYTAAVRSLTEIGAAYPCFCSQEKLEASREKASAHGRPFVYDGVCRDIPREEASRRITAGESHTIRFRVAAGERVEFDDMIGGPRAFENDLLGDFIVQRADGSPIYQLTVVVDDHEMGITHIVRGDDHLSNTPRQILIYRALGWEPPEFGHLPLIQGPDRSRLSKRHGATSILEFAREGILPDAMFNYLALLGWSLDGETELMSRETIIANFSLDRVNRSAAVFDHVKLKWLNGVYLRQMPREKVVELAREECRAAGIARENLDDPWFATIVGLEIERARTVAEIRENLSYFFAARIDQYDEAAAKKHFLVPGAEDLLASLEGELAAAPSFDPADLEPVLRKAAESRGIGFGKCVHPLRLALTGRSASPGIFDVLAGLGRARSIERLFHAREWIERQRTNSGTTKT